MVKTKKNRGFTLIELLIVIAIIALLMAILVPALSRAKEQGKRAVCLTHIKQLQLAWNMYADENNEKIPIGDVWYSWAFPGPPNHTGPQSAWHELPHPWPHAVIKSPDLTGPSRAIMTANLANAKEADWDHATAEGQLWKYVKDYKIYQCPVGDRGQFVTYAMSHSMNTYPGSAGPGSISRTVKSRDMMKRASERFVFIDAGRVKGGAFFLNYDGGGSAPPGTFGDHAPTRHGHGTNFSFIDGHSEYHKWKDGPPDYDNQSTWGGVVGPTPYCHCDWRWFMRVTWGDVPRQCATAGKKCDY